jgi:hypothetical protein
MSYGYSKRVVELNNNADDQLIGVRLGRACIECDVPVLRVAMALGVSRQTVYNWFCGVNAPRASQNEDIESFIRTIQISANC